MITDNQANNEETDFPLEQQVAFLRQNNINFRFDAFEVLKSMLGDKGIEIFKTILKRGYKRAIEMSEGQDFQTITTFMPITDRILGLEEKVDYSKVDEVQYSVTYCPYLEECKRREIDVEFCEILESVGIEEISKSIGEFTEPKRMCKGDAKCIFSIKNTLGR